MSSARTRPRAGPELALGLGVFGVYSLVAGTSWLDRGSAAREHARDVLGLERLLHLDVEMGLNHQLAPHQVLRVVANYEYAISYVISAFVLLTWLWVKRPEVYRWARTSFVWLNLLGVLCFAAYPLQPPRLLGGNGFVDTVRLGHTWGSWGSPLVGHANQLAAMPSLHVAWALWVSVVLAVVHGGWRTQLISAGHVLLTAWVVMASANHYLLDVAGAVLLVALVVHRPRGPVVPSADAFFLYVETPTAPQQVGGVIVLDGTPDRDEVEALVRRELEHLPGFRQRLVEGGRWRRPRWEPVGGLDWSWHVPLVQLHDRPLDDLVTDLAGTTLPRERPLWRLVVVHGVAPDTSAVVLVVHHVIADGIGTVAQAVRLLTPSLPAPASGATAGRARTAAATAIGLAQLACDGRPSTALPSSNTGRFTSWSVPLEQLRDAAHEQGCRVSDVLLSAVATAVHDSLPVPPEVVRFSVPVMLRAPGAAAEGNATGAVLLDLPLREAPLQEIARRTAPLRSPTRALAARAVMRAAGRVLPPVLHARFARSVYGPGRFAAIVSNMPGPPLQLALLDCPLLAVFPLLPLAPGVPLAVGALSTNGSLGLGISVDPALAPDADEFGQRVAAALHHPSTSTSCKRRSGVSSASPRNSRS